MGANFREFWGGDCGGLALACGASSAPVLGTPGTSSVGATTTWGGGGGPAPAGAVGPTWAGAVVGRGVGVGGTEAGVGVGTGGFVGTTPWVPPGVTVTGGAMMLVAVPGGTGAPVTTLRLRS